MALRQIKPTRRAKAKLLVLPLRAKGAQQDAVNGFAAETDEAAMNQPLADHSHGAHRKLRMLLILASAFAWIVIALVIRVAFF